MGTGNLNTRVRYEPKDDYAANLTHSLNDTIAGVYGLLSQVTDLIHSFENNDFRGRINNEQAQGIYKELIDGINGLGDAMSSVLAADRALSDSLREKSQQQTSSVGAIAKSIDEQLRLIDNTLNATRTITASNEEVGIRTKEIEDNAAKIQNVVASIRDVADQTNLLALNAAIEALKDKELGWTIIGLITRDEVTAPLTQVLKASALIGILTIILIFVFNFFIFRMLV